MVNLKIRVKNEAESKEAQELLFSMGCEWCNGEREVKRLKELFIVVDDSKVYLVFYDSFVDYQVDEVTLDDLRAMANQNHDEPFITPECSLNDQYAEIEQVRQQTIEATLAERQAQYGSFEDVAFVTENIMFILAKARTNGLNDLPHTHRMALYMIASKMARIVNGDFNFIESWHDISGYAKLIENELMETDGATNSRVVYQVVKDGVLEDKNES